MRKLILKMSMSLDGFVATSDGKLDWIFANRDPAATAWTMETVWAASLHLMGSRTFRDMAAWWPTSTEVYAAPMNGIPKAVFSTQGPAILQGAAGNWADAYVAGGELAQEIARLKAGDGDPMIAHGGAGFARSLVAQGLVDEYHLLVHPVALGEGLAIFSGLAAPRRLELMKSIAFAAGSVAQLYRPA